MKRASRFALLVPSLVAALALIGANGVADARPHVIIFGGGWGPDGTQASIEAHVQALAAATKAARPTVLFAGGAAGTRSVQIVAPVFDEDSKILGLLFERPTNLDVDYRTPTVASAGPATKASLLEVLSKAKGPTIALGVGHGSRGADDDVARLDLWGGPGDALAVDELAKLVDRRTSPIALVLGHCHSGGFTDLMYPGAIPAANIASPARCVLAAIPRDREASGCTADIRDPSARAYAAVVAEALAGADGADLDGDRKVTLAEAHAYARINDPTIDVPVSTSEAWMRAVVAEVPPRIAGRHLQQIVESARPTERAVVVALAPKGPIAAAEQRFDQLAAKMEVQDKAIGKLEERRAGLRRRLEDRIIERWPELANPLHPIARALLALKPNPIVHAAKTAPELKEILAVDTLLAAADGKLATLERDSAKLERWLRAVENVVFEGAIRRSGTKQQRASLDALLACEAMRP